MTDTPDRPRATRRHWRREAMTIVHWPVSMLTRKHNGERRLSLFRCVLVALTVRFIQNWPTEWTTASVSALAVLALALPIEDLFARVPIAEAADAVKAIFDSKVLGGD